MADKHDPLTALINWAEGQVRALRRAHENPRTGEIEDEHVTAEIAYVQHWIAQLREEAGEPPDDDKIDAVIVSVSDAGDHWNLGLGPDGDTWLSADKTEFPEQPRTGQIATLEPPRVLRIVEPEEYGAEGEHVHAAD